MELVYKNPLLIGYPNGFTHSHWLSWLHLLTNVEAKDCENKDPAGCVRKPFMQPAVSRIPVLAKSLSLQTSSEFKHMQWESKTLASKAKRKKLCTRPVPFNFSQSKRTTKTNTRDIQPETSVHGEKPSKHQGESNKKVKKSHGKTSENGISLTSQALRTPQSKSRNNLVGFDHLNLTFKKPLLLLLFCKCMYAQLKCLQSLFFSYIYLLCRQPMRVSVMSRPKAGPTTGLFLLTVCLVCHAGLARVQFFSDPAALQSVLQNEGVKAGGAFGATPTTSVCPPNRNTSIYTAQRVPVKKKNTEGAVSFCPAAFKETPLQKWTPQRVRNTKHQPMSSMVCTQIVLFNMFILFPAATDLGLLLFGVVQRLFEDQDEDQKTPRMNKEPMTQKEQLQVSSVRREIKDERFVLINLKSKSLQITIFFFFSLLFYCTEVLLPSSTSHNASYSCLLLVSFVAELISEKAFPLKPAVVMLRKRLEELRLDEEVSTYTSVSGPAVFLPPQPRCGNPLASILLFEESTVSLHPLLLQYIFVYPFSIF
uniref:Uncharacterized protein n=1 Tax=Nothobranchius furzeri TaxID=105023 RepID=A0A8C6Q251_NOTFU